MVKVYDLLDFDLEFGRSMVLTHPRPSHTKDFKNGTNCFSV